MNKKKLSGWLSAFAGIAAAIVALKQPKDRVVSAAQIAEWQRICRAVWTEELGRPIDDGSLPGCVDAQRNGASIETVRAGVRNSDEWRERQKPKPEPEPEPLPPVVSLGPLSIDGPIFRQGGRSWRWKGVTAFGLLNRYAHGEDISGFLADVRGFNLLRIFPYVPVKDWKADAWDSPAPETVIAFIRDVEKAGFYVELVLLTDDDPARVDPAKRLLAALAVAHLSNVVIEIGNEPQTHKDITTRALKGATDAAGFLTSSGDYEDSRRWFGQWIGFHSARDGEWPRRAHDAIDYYNGGGPNFPEEPALKAPAVCDEPIRPDQAGFKVEDFRAYFATCALLGAGATYHFESGKFGRRPTTDEARIAAVVLEALDAFPADAPKLPYNRIGEQSLRTYTRGPFMARVRPSGPPVNGWTCEASGILCRKD